MKRGILLATLALAACHHVPVDVPIQVQVVDRPVMVPCVTKIPVPPTYPDTPAALHAAPDVFEQVKLLLAGRTLRDEQERELNAALQACSG